MSYNKINSIKVNFNDFSIDETTSVVNDIIKEIAQHNLYVVDMILENSVLTVNVKRNHVAMEVES